MAGHPAGSTGAAAPPTIAGADVAQRLLLWTTDLSNYLHCEHLTSLSLAEALGAGPRAPKYEDPGAEVLKRKGDEHEQRVLEQYQAQGLKVACVTTPELPAEHAGPPAGDEGDHPSAGPASRGHEGTRKAAQYAAAAQATLDTMRAGPDIIFQGALFDGQWLGRTDFLRKVDKPSPVLGDYSYEVVDAKLSREPKGSHVLQISLYSDLLERAQGTQPEEMHLVLGGPEPREVSFRVNDYAAYYRLVRRRFDAHLAEQGEAIAAAAGLPGSVDAGVTTYPEPCEHCVVCDWKSICQARWREDDHLSLVANIARRQRDELEEREIDTLERLGDAEIPLHPPLQSSSEAATERVQHQARIQLEARRDAEKGGTGRRYELLTPVVPNEGLAALPEPSPGDLFLDFEADRFHEWIGLEYLLGYCDAEGEYTAIWALDRAGEKRMFEQFIDFLVARREQYPDLHVYHYAAYEETALKRLSLRHSTRVEEVDQLLREDVLVDLYRVVRQGLRASVESYSIKRLEPFYGLERDVELRDASSALQQFEAFLELRGDDAEAEEIRARVQGYNRDDCVSTLKLRGWLEGLREELAGELSGETGEAVEVPRPVAEEPEEGDATVSEIAAKIADLEARLVEGIPEAALSGADDAPELTAEQAARLLLSRLLDFHRREEKAHWWTYFTRCDMSEDELVEDRACLGGLQYVEQVGAVKKSLIHRYRFPEQDHELKEGDKPHIAAIRKYAGEIVALDDLRRTVDIKRGASYEMPGRMSLVPEDSVGADAMRDSLLRLAEAVLEDGFGDTDRTRLAADLLMRRPPRAGQAEGAPLRREGEDELAAARRLVRDLDHSVLAIQGPPGSGKTYTGARMIADLLAEGRSIGVTATSHKVIGHLLEGVCEVARERGIEFRGIQKAGDGQDCDDPLIKRIGSPAAVAAAIAEAREAGTPVLAAGTAWQWSREDMAGSVDVLFVDEAGQFSLANALAVAQAAGSLVLLGDPQQLEQPIQGIHPDGAGASALEHLLGSAATIAPGQGLFLAHTWRLHPDLCDFTSEQFYEGKLEPQRSLNRQRVDGPEPFDGTGLRLVPVEHSGNRNHSPEEAEVVARLVDELLESGATWTDPDGKTHEIGLPDILVVAPYNAHVSELREALPENARVGTVDKFQGQEAPIVIYSMATSRPEDAPRGMEFLYDASRLNVATSRARCVAIVVAEPALLRPACTSVRQMWLANGYCRVGEMVAVNSA